MASLTNFVPRVENKTISLATCLIDFQTLVRSQGLVMCSCTQCGDLYSYTVHKKILSCRHALTSGTDPVKYSRHSPAKISLSDVKIALNGNLQSY